MHCSDRRADQRHHQVKMQKSLQLVPPRHGTEAAAGLTKEPAASDRSKINHFRVQRITIQRGSEDALAGRTIWRMTMTKIA